MRKSNTDSFDSSNHTSPGGQCKAKTDKEKEKKCKKIKINLRVSVFFDGTGNNKTNTEIRKIFEEQLAHEQSESSSVATMKKRSGPSDSTDETDLDKNKDEFINTKKSGEEKEKIKEGFDIYSENREKWKKSKFDESFMNAYTNVVFLWRELKEKSTGDEKDKEYERWRKIYLDGIGTSEGEKDDSFQGTGLGEGTNGIIDRAEQAKDNLINSVMNDFYELEQNFISKNEGSEVTVEIDKLDIDVFGFSRGAAAARYFCYIAKNDVSSKIIFTAPSIKNTLLKENKVKVGTVNMIFIGLFDTVSSFGISGTLWEKSNVPELKLDKNPGAQSIIHLCAIDEYRYNFALTTSKHFGGKDYYLPGVHSDIGGSYEDNGNEAKVVRELKDKDLENQYAKLDIGSPSFFQNRKNLKEKCMKLFKEKILKTEKDWYTSRGWITEEEVYYVAVSQADSISKDGLYFLHSPNGVDYQVYLKRSGIRNLYSRIPLHFMKKKGEDKQLSFNPRMLNMGDCGENGIPEELNFLKSQIEASTSLDHFENNTDVKKIRRHHLHFNITLDTTFGLAPYKGRFEKGTYKRNIHKDG